MRDRLKAKPHPALIRHLFVPSIQGEVASLYGYLMRANAAHAVLLARGGIISEADAGALLELYREMQRRGPECLDLDPMLEDLHFNVEKYVIERLGPEVGGRMHTGRSRNDLYSTLQRMHARTAVLWLTDAALALRKVLLDRAEEHAEAVMPGYTHLQPAQPITFGYYLAALADALARDTARVAASYARTNLSPLGCGALAGIGFPLDRELAADLLGFDGLVENSLDGVASRDYVLELLSALAILATTVSRLAGDLYVWVTDEFGLIELADEVSIVSSIMPQKKNPVTLEHCKAKASQVVGALVASLGSMHAAPYSNVHDVNREAVYPLNEAAAQAAGSMRLMEVTVGTLSVRPERMLARAQADFCTVTELADALVRAEGLPFRLAHSVVAAVVVDALAAGRSAAEIDAEALGQAAERVLGRRLSLDDVAVREALDARRSVLGKQTLGSPRPEEVRRMVGRAKAALAAETEWVAERRRRLAAADRRLEEAIEQVLNR